MHRRSCYYLLVFLICIPVRKQWKNNVWITKATQDDRKIHWTSTLNKLVAFEFPYIFYTAHYLPVDKCFIFVHSGKELILFLSYNLLCNWLLVLFSRNKLIGIVNCFDWHKVLYLSFSQKSNKILFFMSSSQTFFKLKHCSHSGVPKYRNDIMF